MKIQEELKELFNMILNHPEQVEKLDLKMKLKNGTTMNYRIDRKKEQNIAEKEMRRQKKLEEKKKREKEREEVARQKQLEKKDKK